MGITQGPEVWYPEGGRGEPVVLETGPKGYLGQGERFNRPGQTISAEGLSQGVEAIYFKTQDAVYRLKNPVSAAGNPELEISRQNKVEKLAEVAGDEETLGTLPITVGDPFEMVGLENQEIKTKPVEEIVILYETVVQKDLAASRPVSRIIQDFKSQES